MKMESKWLISVFMGLDSKCGELLVDNENGVFQTHAFRRRPHEDRWNYDAIICARGTPWNFKEDSDRDRVKVFGPSEKDDPQVPPEPRIKVRRMYVRHADIVHFGPTPGCPGCKALDTNKTIAHNDACRKRIAELLKNTDKGHERVERVARNLDEALKVRHEQIGA